MDFKQVKRFFWHAGMSLFLKNISFHGIVIDNLLEYVSPTWSHLWDLVQKGMKNGIVHPLQSKVFPR